MLPSIWPDQFEEEELSNKSNQFENRNDSELSNRTSDDIFWQKVAAKCEKSRFL
jgi:hypothetical protein